MLASHTRRRVQRAAKKQRTAEQAQTARQKQQALQTQESQTRALRAIHRLRRSGGSARQLLFSGTPASNTSVPGSATSVSGL